MKQKQTWSCQHIIADRMRIVQYLRDLKMVYLRYFAHQSRPKPQLNSGETAGPTNPALPGSQFMLIFQSEYHGLGGIS